MILKLACDQELLCVFLKLCKFFLLEFIKAEVYLLCIARRLNALAVTSVKASCFIKKDDWRSLIFGRVIPAASEHVKHANILRERVMNKDRIPLPEALSKYSEFFNFVYL